MAPSHEQGAWRQQDLPGVRESLVLGLPWPSIPREVPVHLQHPCYHHFPTASAISWSRVDHNPPMVSLCWKWFPHLQVGFGVGLGVRSQAEMRCCLQHRAKQSRPCSGAGDAEASPTPDPTAQSRGEPINPKSQTYHTD